MTASVTDSLSSLPPLPELFGNPMVRGFTEIGPAATVDWTPQTPGWFVLGAVLLIAGARWLWRHYRHWLRNRYRREARQRLDALGKASPSPTAINEVLKLTAMTASSREEVAALTGDAWSAWLLSRVSDGRLDSSAFQPLGNALYNPDDALANQERVRLIEAASIWVEQHRDDHAPD